MNQARRLLDLCNSIPHWFLALIARISIAAVFWQSGRTKVDGLTIKPQAFALFEHEYNVPLLPPGGGHVGFHDGQGDTPWHNRCLATFMDRMVGSGAITMAGQETR